MKNDEMKVFLQKSHLLLLAKFLLVGVFLFFQLSAFAQQRTISGTVTGASNEPLAGVTVVVKGTTIGTLTDSNGKFTLSILPTSNTLLFTFVGMEPKEVAISSSSVYDVVLTQSTIGLDEVVVVGYGTQKKISVTGAIVSVSTADLVQSPTASISNSLSGRVTGLTTVQSSGMPGYDEPNIYVRGIGTLSASNATPLMLVDGVERSFTQIDPNEIESISVLKDASALAVYGIRGANGIILVTTKRGALGAPKISFTSSVGIQVPTRMLEIADSYRYALVYDSAQIRDNRNANLVFSSKTIEAFRTGKYPLIYPNNVWSELLMKNAVPQTQENLNISGGNDFVKYFVSLGFLDQPSFLKNFTGTDNRGYKRYNYRANLDINLSKSTKLSLTMGGRTESRGTSVNSAYWWWLYGGVTPFSGSYVDGKHYLNSTKYISIQTGTDGLNQVGFGVLKSRIVSNVMNLDISLNQGLNFITEGLAWRVKVSNNNTFVQSKSLSKSMPSYDPWFKCDVDPTAVGDSTVVFKMSGSEGVPGYSESSSKSRDWYLETALSYERAFGPHKVTGLLLYNESRSFYPGGTYPDIPIDYVGLAGRATYDYNSKYLVELNMGYNGSQNFAEGNRFGFFPAVSAGWVLTQENFLKDKIPFLSFLKLRISYGVVGNDKQGSNRFLYRPTAYNANSGGISFGTNNATNQLMASEGQIGNPFVTWEKSRKQDYGIDITFFTGKLGLTADYFYEFRDNILTTRNTFSSLYLMSLPAINLGKVKNQGFEVDLKWRNKIGPVNYNIGANGSFARNKIIYMDEVPKVYDYQVQTGLRVGERFGYVFDGFWTAADILHLSDFPDGKYNPKPGDARYKDLNNDNVIDSYDTKPIGLPDYPEIIVNLTGGADYKGFDFSMLWSGVTNCSRDYTNSMFAAAFSDTGQRGLLLYLADNTWTPETAATATLPRISFTGRVNNCTKTSALWVRDASYIRLKNLEIGYSFNDAFLKRLRISKIRIYANGYDLLTFDKIKFFDPENSPSVNYPIIKIINLGITATF